MHIIFGNLTFWQIPIIKLLKYIKFKVFYMYILANSDFKKNAIADKLKKKYFSITDRIREKNSIRSMFYMG